MNVGVYAVLDLKMPRTPSIMFGAYGRCAGCNASAHLVMSMCADCCRKSYESEAS